MIWGHPRDIHDHFAVAHDHAYQWSRHPLLHPLAAKKIRHQGIYRYYRLSARALAEPPRP